MEIEKSYYTALVKIANDYYRFAKLVFHSAHLNKDKTELVYDNNVLKLLADSFLEGDVDRCISDLQFEQKCEVE